MMKLETQILGSLIDDEKYTRRVIPFLKEEYFSDVEDKAVFSKIRDFVEKYNSLPTKSSLLIALQDDRKINEDVYQKCETLINGLVPSEDTGNWLIDETEKLCKDKALYNAIMQSIQIIEGDNRTYTKDALPSILSEALGVGFDNNVGHDYIENSASRFDFYHREEEKIPFDLDYFNKITEGGLLNKTLNVALAGTGVGKSLFMCHLASSYLLQGLNVLYITLEMAEERIAERIDANLLDVTMEDLHDMPQQLYEGKITKLREKTQGQLVIKEYPTASAHSGHFKSLMNELALKKSFRPDVIFIDYLNICASSRFKGGNISSYFYVKAIAEELRGLAVEFNVPIFSATQTTRTGFVSTDIGLEDTSESFGLPATADFMFALMSNEELEALGQMKVKQLKNRYNDPSINRAFIIGVDRAKMRLYDVQQASQNIVDANQTDEKEDAYNKFSDFKL